MTSSSSKVPMRWHEVIWPDDLTAPRALALLRQLASDRRRGPVAFEARAAGGHIRYFIGTQGPEPVTALASTPGVFLVEETAVRTAPTVAGRLRIAPTRVRLGVQPLEDVVRSLLATLAVTKPGESITLQVVLGRAQPPQLPPTRPTPAPRSLPERIVFGPSPHRSEGYTTGTNKRDSHVFSAAVRIGATTSTGDPGLLLRGLLPALRLIERAHARVSLERDRPERLRDPLHRLRPRLLLNLEESLALLAWPIAPDLPGQPSAHPKPLAPRGPASAAARLFARAAAPGRDDPLGITPDEARFHTYVLGPTGAGKSTVLLNLIARDLRDGRSIVVIDPKADLVHDVLAWVPQHRQGDVVLLDPSSDRSVGFNPLARGGLPPHLVADHALSVLAGLFAPLGPRTYDLLNASLLTLTYADRPLTDLPALLTEPGLRRPIVAGLPDESGLAGFWAQFEAYSPQQAAEVIGPTLSRLRQLLLRPGIRRMLSQDQPAFTLADLFIKPRVLLVPLNKGLVGGEAARLVGALLTSALWQTTLGQAARAPRLRRPVHIYVDEVQDYLRLPQDLADALAQSRSLGVAWHLAHQYRRQLTPELRAAIDTNARNKIVFGLAADDARDLAAQAPELEPADFMALGARQVYAQLTEQGSPQGWVLATTMRPPAPISDPVEVLAQAQATYAPPPPQSSAEDRRPPAAAPTSEPLGRKPRKGAA